MNQMHWENRIEGVKLWIQITGSNQDLTQHTEIFVQTNRSIFWEQQCSFRKVNAFWFVTIIFTQNNLQPLCTLSSHIKSIYEWTWWMTDSKNNDYFLPFSYAADFSMPSCVFWWTAHTRNSPQLPGITFGILLLLFLPFAQGVPNLPTGKLLTSFPKITSEWMSMDAKPRVLDGTAVEKKGGKGLI